MRKWEPWQLLIPGLILYATFGIAPILMSVVGSVVDMGAYGTGWIGLSAWRDVLSSERFWKATGTTLKFTAAILPLGMVLVVVLSVVLSWARSKIRAFGRLAFYVPTVTSAMMISIIWRWALASGGVMNELFPGVMFIGSNPAAFWSITAMVQSVTLGGPLIFLMAAFAAIDPELYEAAKLDGCNRAQEAWHITVPGVAHVLVFLLVTRLAGTVQLWQFPYSVTGGGPNYGTTTLMLMTYEEAFLHTRFAHASVMSMVLLAIVGLLLLTSRVITKRGILR